MKLLIGGKEYDYRAALDDASLGLWVDVKRTTGYGRRTMQEALSKFGDITSEVDILEDVTVMEGLMALVYLCRRHGGEHVDWDEVRATDLRELAWRVEDGDLEPDPTSSPAVEPQPAGRGEPSSRGSGGSGGSSKTSKRRSNATA